ncbi:TetR/AcrR family transcriptional regulator [Leeuwenhoekiella sp. MAR_2009_132]|uniref:TetR/AcrR family transcriptional regulator n=1 Tax=Leeuwenhoekiella sp. MAR_2009_132 TaxID=1392489 RepID=UPI00048AAE82|nr:TetR family transcriptional regulator [Leeuwenhoekiella sp. MAR_2009_132]
MDLNEKQLQIIQVAEKLFSEQGFDGTSVRQIAKEADINIAMISYYFGSKEKLLEVLMVYRMANFQGDLLGIIANDSISFFERIDLIIAMMIKRIHANRRIYTIIHSESSNNNRSIQLDQYISQKKDNFKTLENFIKRGQDAGKFSKTVEISLVLPTLIGTYFHFHYNIEFFKGIYDLSTESKIQNYIETTLTTHLQNLIKALLKYEN